MIAKTLFVISFLSFGVLSHQKCNMYPHSAQKCIQNTEKIRCEYDNFGHVCSNNMETNLGCSPNLNKEACLNQLTDGYNNRIQCIFQSKCKTVEKIQLQKYGCYEMFNKNSCLNVQKHSCIWQDNRCQPLKQTIQDNSKICNIFTAPVTPFTCAQLPSGLCMSSGYEGDFQCVELTLDQLSKLSCYELGLNEEACLAINKENQYCIFKDNECMEIKLPDIKSCDNKFSQSLCLSIQNPDIQCEWVDNKCIKFEKNSEFQCVTYNLVNVSVCQIQNGFCQYNVRNHKCMNIEKKLIHLISCDTPGLSRLACLSVQNYNCTFINGRCQELSEFELNFFQCHMELNKQACVNILTPFQYCFWNGNNCERRIINQDYDCPLKFDNNNFIVNGNVCQAISKNNIKCKYNKQTHLCIESSINDICESSFINRFGCLSIIKSDQTCQWTSLGCKNIEVIQYITTCASLGSANPIACSQVHEKEENIGCYFDYIKQKCVTLTIRLNPNANKNEYQQYQQDLETLRNIQCNQIQQGINRITCSSITTKDTACMWKNNQCIQIENMKDIQNIPCLHLQYANYGACSYVQYGGEVCRYNSDIKGCVNSISPHMQCNEPGLNSSGCLKAEGKCQFINNQCQNPDKQTEENNNEIIEIPKPEPSQTCGSTSPTKAVCVSFTATQLICQWSKSKGFCEAVEIKENQYCLDFAKPDIQVNSNVCASILSDFPDYDYQKGNQVDKNRGYCYYNKQTSICQIKKELCNTNCCTENENIGINAHSCSKFSSTEIGVYCYFMNLRCQELTFETVDITNPNEVKQYYNEIKLPCSSMNKNSCHMINWSPEQQCYYNGIICNQFNQKYHNNYRIFTEEPYILNENACIAIDGQITEFNTLKYIGYDDINNRCQELLLDPEYSYNYCEQVKGNRNICQRYTGYSYCKWDEKQLKCITIPYDEYDEIQSCDSELNVRACTDLKNISCLFSYHLDKCIKFNDVNVDCNHFQTIGKVSEQVCVQINKPGQQCQFHNYQCIDSTLTYYRCKGSSANNRSCYANTKFLCRWDSNSLQCYENYTKIEELSCLDNINIELCKKITKEACVWNDILKQCEIFNTINSIDFETFNNTGNHKFNEIACLLITGDAYYYDQYQQKCLKLTSKTIDCNTYQMNKYACLYHTQTHNCYYDEQEILPNNKCKPFIQDQSICQTQWQINIEVCMNIYNPCIFDVATLQCQSFEFLDTMTCTDLSNYSINLQHPNKRVCSSVVQSLEETLGELLCVEDKVNTQECKFQKYCFWSNYSCEIYQIVYNHLDSKSGQEQSQKECPEFQKVDTCFEEITKNESYGKNIQQLIENNWVFINETCNMQIIKYTRNHTYYQLSDNTNVCKIQECSIIERIYCYVITIIETIIPINEITPDNYDASIHDIKVITDNYDECQYFYCGQFTDYDCNIEKAKCQRKKTCKKDITYPHDQYINNDCTIENKYITNHWCLLEENYIINCISHFSKAQCLELSPKCFYDANQGGCMQLEGNEHNIGDCNQIANDCYVSQSHNAICQNGESTIQPGDKCKTVQKEYKYCVPLTTYQSPYFCSDILETDAQPILCARADDDCRYDGKACINSMPKLKGSGSYPCDKSFSKSICEKCGCNYTYLGYCQYYRQEPQLNQDKSNKDFLCYQVNLLDTIYKQEVCTKVDQACAFLDNNCLDATHYSCNQLFELPVSLKACMKCQEHATKYDDIQQKCLNIDNIPNQNTCSNLNQLACLRKTEGVQCKWENFKCNTISIFESDKIECSILNQTACYIKQINICWVDQTTFQCVNYDPYQGKCDLLKTQSLCVRSLYENCKWTLNKCIQNDEITTNTCNNLNQYQCLNAIDIACGWSDLYENCYELQFRYQPYSCKEFLIDYQYQYINRNNYFTCTQIKYKGGCIHDQYYKCREVIPTDILSCEESIISNINEYACIRLTKGYCKFVDNKCQKTQESNLGCQSYLNQQACLLQDFACKFDNYCQSYVIYHTSGIRVYFPYTEKVCQSADFYIYGQVGIGLIYSVAQQKCIDITNKNMMINDCNYVGMNKYTCLLKTNTYCEFYDNQCRNIQMKVISQLKTCKSTLNQFTCTKLNVQCKFYNNQCVPITDKDNCHTLQYEKSIVNLRICLNDHETPCMFNDKTQNCEIITTPQKCIGLNYKGCIFFTQGSYCEFKNSKCITSFGSPNCKADINQDKCLSIITRGQLCYFDKKLGCQNIDTTKIDINKCYKSGLQTNPYTCSRSIDIPCFYDKQNKQCTRYTEQTAYSYQQNYSISNISSFNKWTCQMYNIQKALIWKESCLVVKSSELVYIKCSDLVNKIACLSIQTPYQFCQYKNNKCQNANLDDFKNMSCDQIIDINSGVFCALNQNKIPCEFNKSLFRCQIVVSESISCVEKDPEEKGYNQTCCEKDKNNCTFDENCYRLNYSGFQFCKDIKVDGQYQCNQVTGEGCMIQQNICKKIYYQDYSNITCEQASNRFGCVNIQTQDQYCQFDGEQCKQQDLVQYKDISCLSIVNINNYKFCEQVSDIACTYDLKKKECRNVYQQEEFSCERGLNKIACLNQTIKGLQCKFLEYCYGPNNGIMNCSYNDKEQCCREADSIDTCLNQKIYECEWTNNLCQASKNTLNECDQITNGSFLVCASIKNTLCVFIPTLYKCESQKPSTCGLSQTSQQCKRMKSISCIWNLQEEICNYSEQSAYLSCQQINERSGNQRSCMSVEVPGQMCIFKDEQCLLFIQQEDTNNCLDNINRNACIYQTISDCQWINQVYKVNKYQNSDEEEIVQGECMTITNINKMSCSSNLSYTACLKITKIDQYCIWKDLKCQTIDYQQQYTPNQLIYVNLNACGLVNNGDIVKYDQKQKKCVIIENVQELTCNPVIFGINEAACLSITTQPCIWNSIEKICQYQDILIESQQCDKPHWNAKSCSQLNINQPCGYYINGCQFVDINTIKCTHSGLNKFACLNIKQYPCIWKQDNNNYYYCDDYIPYTSCELVPINVNLKVCQLVDLDACYYDINNNKCENNNLSKMNCDTLGLNIIACIEIDGCVFQEYCQNVNKQIYTCNEYSIANYKVCMNAIDSCKFNELTYGCIQANEELCDTKGLSQQGCNSSKCTLFNNQCLCNSIKDKDCNYITNIEQCNSLSHCIYLKQLNQCKWKQCEDQSYNNCDGLYINSQYCYSNNLQQCKSAKQCDDIHNPFNQKCPSINNEPCIYNSKLNQCQQLICEILNQQECLNYPYYCKYEQSCTFIGCNSIQKNNCDSNICYWNSDMNSCLEQIECSQILQQNKCKQQKYNNNNCQWVNYEQQSFCTLTPCRYLPNIIQCTGVYMEKGICVLLTDQTCVSCEEIQSSCICLQNNDYCDYNFKEMKCYSKICENYLTKEDCPEEYCEFQETCLPQCNSLQYQQQCDNKQYCIWKDQQCKKKDQYVRANNEEESYGELIQLILLSILILQI
ncbi:unnamed protein product [Paramecium primaurelia]|uniref:PSI domain-containing protein n=1 Tax=Paramecium primaurelia TaxID=5886 RepID=A0A8S1K8G7_PARPR|nr:unnamed protein product [Paramecium primaurelia]